MLAAATGHDVSHVLARVDEIRRFEVRILIHESDIGHASGMGVALNGIVQCFFLCIKPSVVVD